MKCCCTCRALEGSAAVNCSLVTLNWVVAVITSVPAEQLTISAIHNQINEYFNHKLA